MKQLVKLFIYWAIIAIVSIFNNALSVQAKPSGGLNGLMLMDDLPQKPPQFEALSSRTRRSAESLMAGEDPSQQDKPENHFRTRRQAAPGESDVTKGLQQNPDKTRAKRQMPPSPPLPPGADKMPMPLL